MLKRVFKAFQYRDFRIMWMGACTSSIGTWMQQLAQAWLIYPTLSHDPFYLGLDVFLGQAPIILFSLVGGVIADRYNRRYLLLISQYIQMACAFILTTLLLFHAVHIWQVLALSFTVGLAQSMGGPAYMALIPTLVGPEDLENAIALNSIQFNLARVIGPAIGGLALTTLGAAWCFGLNGVSFIAVIISLYVIYIRFVPARTSEPMLTSMKQGFGFIRKQAGMQSLIVLAFCMTIFGFPLMVFLPVFAREVFQKGPATYTLFLCCSGIGSICGALVVAGRGKLKGQGRIALTMLIVLGAVIVGFALSKSIVLSCVLIFFSGGALISVFTMVSSLVQAITADDMRGRVMSVYNVAFRGGMPIGSLVIGRLIPRFTAPYTIACAGSVLAALGIYFLFVHRRIAAL